MSTFCDLCGGPCCELDRAPARAAPALIPKNLVGYWLTRLDGVASEIADAAEEYTNVEYALTELRDVIAELRKLL